MNTLLDTLITGPLKDFLHRVLEFLPALMTSVIIFALGFLVGWVLKSVLVRILTMVNTDRFCTKVGISQVWQKVGITDTPTAIIGKSVYWLAVFVFIIIALYALQIPAIGDLLQKFFLYLPNLVVAALLLTIGYILGNFLGRTVLIASVNAGIRFSALLANAVKAVVVLVAFAMALEQLGIGRGTVIVAFTILFGGFIFALSLAFGLGGKDIARDYLEKHLKEKTEDDDELRHI